jgi:hypothetical protein
LATDYLAAKRSRKFVEVERLIVAYDLSVHLKTHRHAPGGGPALKLDQVWGRALSRHHPSLPIIASLGGSSAHRFPSWRTGRLPR